MTKLTLRGIIPPLITPFLLTEEIDESTLRQEMRFMLGANVHGISFGGSTGEGAILGDDELARGIQIVQEENTKNIPVLCGIIRNSTREAINASLVAKSAGADALLVTPTFYFEGFEKDNINFFMTLAEKVELPIIIYNVIKGNPISPHLMKKLCENDWIIGIKQSYGGIHALTDMISICGENTVVFTAQDDLLFVAYLLGAVGAIAAILSIFPAQCVQQWHAVQSGDFEFAQNIHYKILPIWRKIEGKAFPSKIKATLNLMGRGVGMARSPMGEPTKKVIDEIRQELINAKFL